MTTVFRYNTYTVEYETFFSNGKKSNRVVHKTQVPKTIKNGGIPMTNEKELCSVCGTALNDEGKCPACSGQNNTDILQEINISDGEMPKQEKSKFSQIIITVLIIALASTFGKFLANKLMGNKSEDDYLKEMDRHIEEVNKYVPGTISDETYSSQYWGLKFKCDNDWVMLEDEQLKAFSEQTRNSAYESSMATLNSEENISQELKDKWKDAFYAEAEMAACYYSQSDIVGEVTIAVMSGYGMNDISQQQYAEEMKKGLAEAHNMNVTLEEDSVAGEKYNVLCIDIDGDDSGSVVNKMYIRKKGVFMLMMTVKSAKANESEVFESFNKLMQKY